MDFNTKDDDSRNIQKTHEIMVEGENKPPQPKQINSYSDTLPASSAIMDAGNKRKLTTTASSTLVKGLRPRPFITDSENTENQNQGDRIVQGDWHTMDADGLLQKYTIAELNGFQVRIK